MSRHLDRPGEVDQLGQSPRYTRTGISTQHIIIYIHMFIHHEGRQKYKNKHTDTQTDMSYGTMALYKCSIIFF